MSDLEKRIARLKADLIEQGRRVQVIVEAGVEAAFTRNATAAAEVVEQDELIDRVDVDIEKAAVALLGDAMQGTGGLTPAQLRMVLTVVKVNNELERIADVGVAIAEEVPDLEKTQTALPETFRIVANSVIGMLRDVNNAFDRMDSERAKRVLENEDAVEAFRRSLVRDLQDRLCNGTIDAETAFVLQAIATFCEIMSSHCTNIAEQTLYVTTGTIVRHMEGKWEEFEIRPRG